MRRLGLFAAVAASLLSTTALAQTLSPAEFAGAILADAPDVAALNARCDEYVAEVELRFAALESSAGPHTIDSTLKAYDDLSALSYYAGAEFYSFSQSMDSAEKRDAGRACYARLDEIGSRMGLSRPIYDRLKAIDASTADEGTRYYLTQILSGYERSGVNYDEARRAQIKTLLDEMTAIGNNFGANYANARSVMRVLPSQLAGLPADWLAAHPPGTDGLVAVSTDGPDLTPIASYAQDDALRETLLRLNYSRAYPENSALLGELFTKRDELAHLLDRPNFAALTFEDRMLTTPAAVEAHMAELAEAAAPSAAADLAVLQRTLAEARPGAELTLFNSGFARQRALLAGYDLNPQEVRAYFTFDNVRQGVFDLTQDLFRIEIRLWDTPLWHPDVEAFEIYDGGELLGQFYLDSHPRPGKYQHANHIALRRGVTGESVPVSVLTMNLPRGGYDTGLMEHAQVETFLHEFGHLIHNILGGNQRWFGVSGVSTERDFVEAPSQMLEEWVYDYDTLARFARNEAGEVIPRALVDRMTAARWFGNGIYELGQLGYSNASLGFHQGAPADPSAEGITRATQQYVNEYTVLDFPETTHFEATFSHLDGYSAGYYTYGWSRVIAADLFSRFESAGLRDPETAMAYRNLVLGRGGSRPAADMIAEFLGRPVNTDAFRAMLAKGSQ